MIDFKETNENEDALDAPRVAWCATCEGPVDLDENGRCTDCRDSGERDDVENVVLEPVPDSSPRSIECQLCGADPGEFCRPGSDGDGYNHAERVEDHEEQFDVLAARPLARGGR